MKLLDWLRAEKIDDRTLAERLGGCSSYAVKKWKYGERMPGAARIIQLEEITGGHVTLRDWVAPAAAPPAEQEPERAA